MTQHNIEEIKKSAITYMQKQNTPVTYETVARKLGIRRKVMKYVFFSNKDVFKGRLKYICAKRHVYTL